MKRNSLRVWVFVFIINCLSCDGDKEVFQDLTIPIPKKEVEWKELSNKNERTDKVECQVKEVEWGPGYQELNSFDPQGEVIYPGSIIDYESFDNGAYKPIIGNRNAINLSISLSNLSGTITKKVEEVSLSSVRQAIQEILNTKTGSTAAFVTWKEHKIYSQRHFDLAVGGNYGNSFAKVAASFDFSKTDVTSRYLIEFTQVYYSIDIDLLGPGIKNYYAEPPLGLTSNKSPVIISSVKYGRKVFIAVESKEKSFDQNSSLVASFSSFWGSGGIKADQNLSELFKELAVKGVILGGSASSAVPVVLDISQLRNYLITGANYSNINLGIPLSYNLRFIHDNSIAKLVQYDKFLIRDCKIIPEDIITISKPNDVDKLCNKDFAGGDREFDGHGPDIEYEVSTYVAGTNNEQLFYKVFLHLKEDKDNFTEATFQRDLKIYTAPTNKSISKIISTNMSGKFKDLDVALTTIYGADEFSIARLIEIQGDTNGNDVGNCTDDDSFISVYWNPIKIVLKNR